MEAIRRIEIIVPQSELEAVISLLEDYQVTGYTIIENARGKGHRGVQDGLGLTDAFSNALLIWYGSAPEFEQLKEPIRELLAEAGGVCAVSEGSWVIH